MQLKTFAWIISVLFHPVLIAITVPFLIIYHQTSNIIYALKWTFFSLAFICVGLFAIFLTRGGKFFTDFDIEHKENRSLFYAICCFFAMLYFIVALLFKGIFFSLSIIALGIIFGIILFEIVNFYVKASVHSGIACAYVITISVLYGWNNFFLFVWIVPLVVWSRLYLKKHTAIELLAGILLGGIITGVTVIIARLFLICMQSNCL